MLNETTSKMFVVAGAASTGSIATDAIKQSKTDQVVQALADKAPDALIQVRSIVESSDGVDWAMWSQVAGIAGVIAMILRFAFEIFFKIKYERGTNTHRRSTDE